MNDLSEQLGKRYGQGFSITNLRCFRLFYQAFSDREPAIHHSASDELAALAEDAVMVDMKTALQTTDKLQGFSPNLSWTHYRTLCKVEHRAGAEDKAVAQRLLNDLTTALTKTK